MEFYRNYTEIGLTFDELITLRIKQKECCSAKPCYKPCVKKTMMGRSWWKSHGYNSACHCLSIELDEVIKELRIKKNPMDIHSPIKKI
tara:strand:- start:691 stop:954 length:264 start_codon:yes stop_codon:yes gene_type:complete